MKFIRKIVGVITTTEIEDSLNEIVAELEHSRNTIRKETFEEMDKLNPVKDGEKIQRLLLQMNKDLTLSYEKEKVLREFISKL